MQDKRKKDIFNMAAKMYELHGIQSVIDFADRLKIKETKDCSQCETRTPAIDGVCLVCGQ